jgi:YD repeat-containing protein
MTRRRDLTKLSTKQLKTEFEHADMGIRAMIGAKATAGIMLVLLLIPTDAMAQSRSFYGADGRLTGRSTTGSNGATTFFNASGKVTGRSSTSGNQTTIYGSDGRRVGTVTTTRP